MRMTTEPWLPRWIWNGTDFRGARGQAKDFVAMAMRKLVFTKLGIKPPGLGDLKVIILYAEAV